MAYVPISREAHDEKFWIAHTSLLFAKNDVVAPIFVNELPLAIQSIPVAFIKQDDRFVLVAVMGLREKENLLISLDGKWLTSFMPVIYRSSPFEYLAVSGQENQYVLCIDDACITEGPGQPFFKEDGSITETIAEVFKLVQQFNATRKLTNDICEALTKHNLIQPWSIRLSDGNEDRDVIGFYRIDEAALNNLSDQDFLDLRKSHALPTIYSQLLSMHKISYLQERLIQETMASESAKQKLSNDTFSFSGL